MDKLTANTFALVPPNLRKRRPFPLSLYSTMGKRVKSNMPNEEVHEMHY